MWQGMPDLRVARPAQTLLGFDFGLKHIGVAVGQTITLSANPLTVLKASKGIPQWDELKQLIKTWKPDALVVGKPLNMDGTTQPIGDAAQKFAATLRERYGLPVYEIDERLSSVAARDAIFTKGGYRALNKKAIDSTAAQLILLDWLNTKDRGNQ